MKTGAMRRRNVFKEMRQDRVAMDRSPSSRTIDPDGHMRIVASPVSKANVCEYWGAEIPGADELGLEPRKSYKMYRDPGELKRAASSLNGKPLLNIHRAQTASDHDSEAVIGSLDGVFWDPPYLKANLTVWSQDAIDAINSGRQRQLSCSYRYTPVMKPGVSPDGVRYDGRMTALSFNHTAIVETGRAGPDVMVGDSVQRKLRKGTKRMATDTDTDADGDDNDVRTQLLDYLAKVGLTGRSILQVIAILDGTAGDDDEDETAADPEVAAADRARVAAARQRRLAADDASRRARFPNANRLR